MPDINEKHTYNSTGSKPLILLKDQEKGINRATIKASSSDNYDVEIQMSQDAERIKIPSLTGFSGDALFEIPEKIYAIGLNITTITGDIILDLQSI